MFDTDRLIHLEKLQEAGLNPYDNYGFKTTETIHDYLNSFEYYLNSFEKFSNEPGLYNVSLAGRIISMRIMGNITFIDISDGSHKVQTVFRKNLMNPDTYKALKYVDEGDHIGVTGYAFLTQAGEKSVLVTEVKILSKSIIPLPIGKRKDDEVFNAVLDPDIRLRHRHIDLIANPESRKTLIARAKMLSTIRRFLDQEDFLEVETPLLTEVAGGASARTFDTHFNAYDLDMHLRISLEIPLKKLICGDIPAVYEIGKVFRNEGADATHNPEFTLLEWYRAYSTPEEEMYRIENLVSLLMRRDKLSFVLPNGETWGSTDQWQTLYVSAALTLFVPHCEHEDLESLESIRAIAEKNGIYVKDQDTYGKIEEKLLSVFVEPNLISPTFLCGHHISNSPLARRIPGMKDRAHRFEAYINGYEIANGYSELNNAVEQKERLEDQVAQRNGGDAEAQPYDQDFIYALAGGMPPTTGVGIGLDRLAMVLYGASQIRQVVMFPTMKPKS